MLETKKPRFLDNNISAADKGTATHLFLQFCDLNNLKPTKESIEDEVSRLVINKYTSDNIANLIRTDELVKFTKSDLFLAFRRHFAKR